MRFSFRPADRIRDGMGAPAGKDPDGVPAEGPASMPRQRTQYRTKPHGFPDDFPQRLVWFKHASGLSWVEIARRLGVDPVTVRRWWQRGVRPNYRHLKALQDLADDLDLGHLFTG